MTPSSELEEILETPHQLKDEFEILFINSCRLDIVIGIDRCASLEDPNSRKEAVGLLLQKFEQENTHD